MKWQQIPLVVTSILAVVLGLYALRLHLDRKKPADSAHSLLSEEQVTPARVQQIFTSVMLKAELDEDGDNKVQTEFGIAVWVTIDAKRKLVKYVATYGFKGKVGDIQRVQFAHKLNDNVILVRFSVPRPDVLLADYYLPYENGITPSQIVHALREFARITVAAVREHDTADLIE